MSIQEFANFAKYFVNKSVGESMNLRQKNRNLSKDLTKLKTWQRETIQIIIKIMHWRTFDATMVPSEEYQKLNFHWSTSKFRLRDAHNFSMANLMVHQTIPYWQVYSEKFDAARGQTYIPQVKGWLQTIYSWHFMTLGQQCTLDLQYVHTKSIKNVDKGFTCYSRPVAACRCAHRSRGNPRHVIKTTLHSLYICFQCRHCGIMCCTFDSCSCLFCHFHLRAEATILYTHTTHSIDAHIRALNYNTPSRKGARPHRHKHKRPPYTHNPPCSGNA